MIKARTEGVRHLKKQLTHKSKAFSDIIRIVLQV